MNTVVGDGDPSKFNKTLVRVADVNGTDTIVINGTLPNGTTASGDTSAASDLVAPTVVGWSLIALTMAAALSGL
jgi:hypothetical protein